MKIIFILLHLLLLNLLTNTKFCSVFCNTNECSSIQSRSCTGTTGTGCYGPFKKDANGQCLETDTSHALIGYSTDADGDIQMTNITNIGFNATCGSTSGGGWKYQFYGALKGTDVIQFKRDYGTDLPHYRLRVILWFMFYDWDDWKDDDAIVVRVNSVSQSMWRINVTQNYQKQKLCDNSSKYQGFLRYDRQFSHNDSNQFTVKVTTNNTGSRKWGVKEIVVLAKLCNYYCTACQGPAINNCFECSQADGIMKLSGKTCNQSCLPQYGQTIDIIKCVRCNDKCVTCFQQETNCTQCTPNNIYNNNSNAAFLIIENNTCVTTCPNGSYGNTTDRICYPCDPSCTSCRFNSTYCDSCNTALNYAYKNHICYNPCPYRNYLHSNLTNCTSCNTKCLACQGSSTNCSVCETSGSDTSYLLGNTCYNPNCPQQYYGTTISGANICQSCDPSCKTCTERPTPCQSCNDNYYLYNSQCGTICPQLYFPDNSTWMCLQCQIYCVQAKLSIQFKSSLNDAVEVDVSFTQNMNWTTFPYKTFQTFSFDNPMYNIDMFFITYQTITPKLYRITIQPKGYIFLYNATLTVTTNSITYPLHTSINARPFKKQSYGISTSIVWFVIKAPDMSNSQKQIIQKLDAFSQSVNSFSTIKYVQQIKKTGIFSLLFSGAQITSGSVLVNNIPAQNMYSGVRFWASFVLFDVPNWEENSNHIKYAISDTVADKVARRRLFSISSVQWRFARTGHTSFFIYDTYPSLILILICWLLVIIALIIRKSKPQFYRTHSGKIYSLLHKVHQISIMYITINTILQWLYFNKHTTQKWLSLIFCILINIYFLSYQLYMYYDLMKYPLAKIGNPKYQYYARHYGMYLKHIRYQEYDMTIAWTMKHWLRPYNYHILSYYKKLMMMVALPVFYSIQHAQVGVLIILQLGQIARLCFTWPFFKTWRNIVRLILQCILCVFFICLLIQGFLVSQIMLNNPNTVNNSIKIFYKIGWISFVMVFTFNCSFLILFISDLFLNCKKNNIQIMDQIRRQYYYSKIKQYQIEVHDVPPKLMNKWVRLGNLNKRNYQQLPTINLLIQTIKMTKTTNNNFNLSINKSYKLSIKSQINHRKQNNIQSHKIIDQFIINQQHNLYHPFISLLSNHHINISDISTITIKTFLKIQQEIYKPGQSIQQKSQNMYQKLQFELYSGQIKSQNTHQIIHGFPISIKTLESLGIDVNHPNNKQIII